jgi:hypothetical protein
MRSINSKLECWEPSHNSLIDRHREIKETCAELAGRSTFRILTASRQSGDYSI